MTKTISDVEVNSMQQVQVNKQELNRKLAEWAGFTAVKLEDCGDAELLMYKGNDPLAFGKRIMIPDFTQSLDACFKWLVPKLEPLGYDLEIKNDLELMGWSACLSNTKSERSIASPMEHCELQDIAVALCLAIEKLIDAGSAGS